MTSRMRWLLMAGMAATGGLLGPCAHSANSTPTAAAAHPLRLLRTQPIQAVFTTAQFAQFLSDAHRAEGIDDPLQRCLAYPEPPGVQWSKATTTAYCHYMLDPAVTAAAALELIENGHAAELERRLAKAKQAQLTRPDAQSMLDRTYNIVFAKGSNDTRALMDAWKRQSPDNPYALAASGAAYVAMAQDQRGSEYASKTSADALDAMHRLLQLGRTDLDRAAALDPQLTPAYNAMILAAGLEGDDAYALSAAKRGLAADAASYPIYARLVWMSQPKWGGNVARMQHIIDDAQRHAGRNPLLRLLLSERTGGEAAVEDCACDPFAEEDLYRHVFAEAAPVRMLMSAGWAAHNRNNLALSVIYRSELLRFYPSSRDHREGRAFDLIQLGQPDWGLAEGNALIKQAPQDETTYDVRGQAYRVLGDATHAADDFEQALRLNPSDTWTLSALGDIYVSVTHDWDKGWVVANRLIQLTPDDPRGWFLRANIQQQQPRDGLDQTVREFTERFGSDPQKHQLVLIMQAMIPRSPTP